MNLRPRSIRALNSKTVYQPEIPITLTNGKVASSIQKDLGGPEYSSYQNSDLIDGVCERVDRNMFTPPNSDEYIDGVLLVTNPENSKKIKKGQLLYFYCDKDTLKNGSFQKGHFKEGLMVDFEEDFNGICTVEIHDTELVNQEGKWVINVNDNGNKKYININYVPVVGLTYAT